MFTNEEKVNLLRQNGYPFWNQLRQPKMLNYRLAILKNASVSLIHFYHSLKIFEHADHEALEKQIREEKEFAAAEERRKNKQKAPPITDEDEQLSIALSLSMSNQPTAYDDDDLAIALTLSMQEQQPPPAKIEEPVKLSPEYEDLTSVTWDPENENSFFYDDGIGNGNDDDGIGSGNDDEYFEDYDENYDYDFPSDSDQ